MKTKFISLLFLLSCPFLLLKGQEVWLMDYESSYAEDFNSLPTGSETDVKGPWVDGETLPGWYLFSDGSAGPTPAELKYMNVKTSWKADSLAFGNATGFLNVGYNFESDRAIAGFISNAVGNVSIFLKLKNMDETQPITKLSVKYTGEQWSCASTAVHDLVFSYKVNATDLTDISGWTEVESLKFSSPSLHDKGGLSKYINGNEPENRVENLNAVLDVNIPVGGTIVFRWYDVNDLSTDHILAIDDFEVSATFGDNSSIDGLDRVNAVEAQKLSSNNWLLKAAEPFNRVAVYNAMGQQVQVATGLNSVEESISLSACAPGIYYVKVQMNNGTDKTIKLVK